MSTVIFRRSAEGFAIASAVVGVLLAALLSQTKVLAFTSFKMMVVIFLVADVLLYLTMKTGIIKPPGARGPQKG
ncbi:MAG: hypothetical protein ABIZ36_11545 [Gemmatimonadaceae bacterium]